MDRAVRRMAFKYTMRDDGLYHRTINDVLLKCLDEDQARVAMGEVHEGICGTHQLAPKMKWLLRRAGFYWPTMINDCFRYYKGCEACQKFGDIQLAPAAMLHYQAVALQRMGFRLYWANSSIFLKGASVCIGGN